MFFTSESQELLPEISDAVDIVTANSDDTDLEVVIGTISNVINVTIPVQCMVEEQSKLILYEGSKSSSAGFYDPCSDEDKQLLVHYLYQRKHHQVLISDEEQVRCPRLSHQVPNQ